MNSKLERQVESILLKHKLKVSERTLKRFLNFLESIIDELTPELIEIFVLDNLTIGESYFFRDRKVFDFLKKVMQYKVEWNILSVGCSRGEEVYSLSIIARESGRNCKITGIDISPQRIEEARRGCYKFWSVRFLSEDELERFFIKNDDKFCIKSDYKANVTFVSGNFLTVPFSESFDIIFARRVLLYAENEELVVRKIYSLLKNDGVLVLGSGEYFPTVLKDFEPINECPCVYKKVSRKSSKFSDEKHVKDKRPKTSFISTQNDISEEVKYLKEAIAKNLENELALEPTIRIVEHCLENKILSEAENYLAILVRKYPTHYLVWKYLGVLELEKGNYEAAEKHLKKAAFLNHSDDEIWQLLHFIKGRK